MDGFEWVIEMIYVVKSFYDYGKLDQLVELVGDMPYDPDYCYELILEAPFAVFADARRYYQDESRCGEVEVTVLYDPTFYNYNLLCRAYEAKNRIAKTENPYVKRMEEEVDAALDFHNYAFGYHCYTKTDREKDCRLVLLSGPEFDGWYAVPEALFRLYEFFEEGVAKLEKELQRDLATVIALPAPRRAERKEAA